MSDTSGKGPETQATGGIGQQAPKPNPARPRPPMIDAEARDVTTRTAAAPAPPPRPSGPEASASSTKPAGAIDTPAATAKASGTFPPKTETPKPQAASTPRIPVKDKDNGTALVPLIAAGVGGAALATFLIISLGAAGVLPSGNDRRIASLEGDLARMQDALSTAGGPRTDPRVAAIEQHLADMDARFAALSEAPRASAPSPNLENRLSSLEQGAKDALARLDTLARERAEANSALEHRIEDLLRAAGSQNAAAASPASRAAVALAASAALDAAIDRGQPYTSELAALKALIPSADTSALEGSAQQGLSTAAAISARWRHAVENAPPPPPPADAPWAAKFMASARALVHVTPLGEPEGDAPDARRARFIAALDRADLAAAMTEWNRFDPFIQNAAAKPAGEAAERLAVENTMATIRIAALNEARATVESR